LLHVPDAIDQVLRDAGGHVFGIKRAVKIRAQKADGVQAHVVFVRVGIMFHGAVGANALPLEKGGQSNEIRTGCRWFPQFPALVS